MTATNEMREREAGGIIFSRKKNARELVDKAYVQAEKMAWRTLKERQEGNNSWSGTPYTSAVDAEEDLEISGTRWKNYCKNLQEKHKTIVPTKPHRPIGNADKENKVPSNRVKGKENKSQQQLVNEWIEKVMKEDEMKKRNRSEEKMGDVEASGKKQRSPLSELKGVIRSKK